METRNNTSEVPAYMYKVGWYAITSLVSGIFGFLSNLVVCVVLLREIRNKPYTKRYSLSLASGNLLYSVSGMCIFLRIAVAGLLNSTICRIYVFIDFLGYYACVMSLILLALERFCAIRFPIYFRKLTTLRNIHLQLACGWIMCTILTIYPVIAYEAIPVNGTSTSFLICSAKVKAIAFYNLTFDMVLPLLVFLSLTVCAICILKKRSTVSVAGGNARGGGGSTLKKSWMHLTFIAVMFCMCFGCYFAYALVPISVPRMQNSAGVELAGEIVHVLTLLHTWFNPVMHWVCDASFRQVLTDIVSCKHRRQQDVSRETAFSIG